MYGGKISYRSEEENVEMFVQDINDMFLFREIDPPEHFRGRHIFSSMCVTPEM